MIIHTSSAKVAASSVFVPACYYYHCTAVATAAATGTAVSVVVVVVSLQTSVAAVAVAITAAFSATVVSFLLWLLLKGDVGSRIYNTAY
jgi:uncharacterized membrane protein